MALVKCGECGKEISSMAAACPSCGHPSASASVENESTEPAPTSNRIGTGQGLFLIAIVSVVGCWLLFNFENKPGGPPSTKERLLIGPTKAAWKQKLGDNFKGANGMVQVGHLRQVFGEPQSTQTVGEQTYWYYKCSDGMIQVVINGYQFLGNSSYTETINDY